MDARLIKRVEPRLSHYESVSFPSAPVLLFNDATDLPKRFLQVLYVSKARYTTTAYTKALVSNLASIPFSLLYLYVSCVVR